MWDTIVAVAAGLVNSPISIIRVAGPEAFRIAKAVFTGPVGEHRTITYGTIVDGHAVVDEVLVSWFRAPHTYSGDDIVEINAHGGVVNTNKILRLLIAQGARPAERGEFTRRAFLNGKINLVKAEAIHDLIFARTESEAQLFVKKFDGHTSKLLETLQQDLMRVIAVMETNIDYPEYDDVETLVTTTLLPRLVALREQITAVIEASTTSRHIYEGIRVAIVGRPNAGKSSLLNALIGEEKAIVAAQAGTTRDVVEGSVQVGQLLLRIQDTAGIRATKNAIEQAGIARALTAIARADLVIHVCDATRALDADDERITQASRHKTYLQVFNKSDLKPGPGLRISAKHGDIAQLLTALPTLFPSVDINNDYIIANVRQLALIEKAAHEIDEAISGLQAGHDPSVVIVDVRAAWESLANILGRADQADLLDMIFRNFCLGK